MSLPEKLIAVGGAISIVKQGCMADIVVALVRPTVDIDDIEMAREIVRRYNSHDKLLDACNSALRVILQSKCVPYRDEVIIELNAAIAEAEKNLKEVKK